MYFMYSTNKTTRMHSSRMRTVRRCSGRLGGACLPGGGGGLCLSEGYLPRGFLFHSVKTKFVNVQFDKIKSIKLLIFKKIITTSI